MLLSLSEPPAPPMGPSVGQLKWDPDTSTRGPAKLGAPAAMSICIQATPAP